MCIIYITLERGGPKFSNITARALAVQQRQLRQNGYYAAQDIFVREFIKTESATAVRRAFRLRYNIQPPMWKNYF
jgi:hypothetical protein